MSLEETSRCIEDKQSKGEGRPVNGNIPQGLHFHPEVIDIDFNF